MRLAFSLALFGALCAGSASASGFNDIIDSIDARSTGVSAEKLSPVPYYQLPASSTRCFLFEYNKAKNCKKAGDVSSKQPNADAVLVFFAPPSAEECSAFKIYYKCKGDKFCAMSDKVAFMQYEVQGDYVGIGSVSTSFPECQSGLYPEFSQLDVVDADGVTCNKQGGKNHSRLKVVCETGNGGGGDLP